MYHVTDLFLALFVIMTSGALVAAYSEKDYLPYCYSALAFFSLSFIL